jgi:Sensors of blue-light using FAD
MEIYELIYCSVANPNLAEKDIFDILEIARDFNSRNDITGCLLFHNKEFIQILEGDKKILQDLIEKIKKDDRHSNVMVLAENEIEKRVFDKWSMAYHKVENDDVINVDRLIFVNNFVTLSELIAKPTHASRVFWYMAKQLLQE